MSLSGIFNVGMSALQATQTGLRVVSQNVANVNTPSYADEQVSLGADSATGGVDVASVQRVVNQFLAAAAMSAAAQQGGASARSSLLSQAQSAFGDPTSSSSVFGSLNTVVSSFSTLASNPTSAVSQSGAISATQSLLAQIGAVGGQLNTLRMQADQQVSTDVTQANSLLSQIAALNTQIQTTTASGADPTAAQNNQARLIDQLSALVDIKVSAQPGGAVQIRTGVGALLVSNNQAASLSTTPLSGPYAVGSTLQITTLGGASEPLEGQITSGSLAGLLQARDTDLPALAASLGQLAGSTASALNGVSNNSTSTPAQTTLTGRQTGLVAGDALNFTGKAKIGVTDSSGNLVETVAIDFGAGTYSVNGGAAVSFGGPGATIAQFATGINTALGANGSIGFANGVVTLQGSGSNGVFVQQDAATPSARGGYGFGQFFGLNDLVTSSGPSFFQTGLSGSDPSGLTAGGALSFQVVDATGRPVLARTVSVTGATWGTMIAALNDPVGGIGSYGSFGLNSSGALSAALPQGFSLEITGDTTQIGGTGLSMSSLFGLDQASTAGRALALQVNPKLVANPSLLASAQPDLTQPLGTNILNAGDNSGDLAYAALGSGSLAIPAAGALSAQTTSLSNYASLVGAQAGQTASAASSALTSAQTLLSAATAQRSAVEGVTLDNELVKMTQYQQSYSAAARVITAAQTMYDTLLTMVPA